MSFRATIIVAILLALLAGFAYYDYKSGQKKEDQKEKEKILIQIKKEDVAEIRIDGLEQPVKLQADKEDTWKMVEPIQTRADDATISRILTNFEDLKYRDIVEEQPKDLAQFGLDKPHITIHLILKNNKGEKTLMIGVKNPVDNVTYTRVGNDQRVYTVENASQDLASTTIFDLRDKKITDFDTEKVESFSIHQASEDLEFKKSSDIWKMKRPLSSPAAEVEITSLLSSLAGLRVTRFVDKPEDLERYGLKTPSAVVDILQEKGLRQKILFGSKEGEQIYCLVEGSNVIASVSDSVSSFFGKKLEEWREKRLAVFNRFDADEIKIHAMGKDWIFKKGKEEKWTQESPQKKEIEAEKLQDLLEKLETAEISKYGDTPSLQGTPMLEFSGAFKDWQDKVSKKHLVFGVVKDNLQQVKNDDFETVVYADGSLQGQIEKALSELNPAPQTAVQTKPQ